MKLLVFTIWRSSFGAQSQLLGGKRKCKIFFIWDFGWQKSFYTKNFICRVKLVVALITASLSALSASVNEGFNLNNIILKNKKSLSRSFQYYCTNYSFNLRSIHLSLKNGTLHFPLLFLLRTLQFHNLHYSAHIKK